MAAVARRSHGVASRDELIKAGLDGSDIDRRVESGALIVVYRGVYRVGHAAPSAEASFIAAVKACGDGALLSGRAAAYLWGLIKGKPPKPEVTVPGEREIEGIVTHRARAGIDRRDRRRWLEIPVTSVPRTIVDLAADTEVRELARIFHEAAVKYRIDLLTVAGLPLPMTNRRARSLLIDCRWPEHKVTVELDSYTYHSTPHAWKQDRRRDREAYDRDDRVRRFTYDEVMDEPEYVIKAVRHLLERG